MKNRVESIFLSRDLLAPLFLNCHLLLEGRYDPTGNQDHQVETRHCVFTSRKTNYVRLCLSVYVSVPVSVSASHILSLLLKSIYVPITPYLVRCWWRPLMALVSAVRTRIHRYRFDGRYVTLPTRGKLGHVFSFLITVMVVSVFKSVGFL